MSSKGFRERILEIDQDGAALTGTSAASLLPAALKTVALPIGFFDQTQKRIVFEFSGRISNIVTTPGTLNLKFLLGSIAVFDSLLIPLNVVAKTNVHWKCWGELVCRAFGASTTTTLFPKGCQFLSESYIGSPLPSVGGSGTVLLPYNTAPVVGAGFDNSAVQVPDFTGIFSLTGNSCTLQAGHIDLYSN